MSRETNTEKFFTPPKNPQKSDVNWHIKDNEDSKTNLLGCRHLSIMEKLMEQFVDNFSLRASKQKKSKKCNAPHQKKNFEKWCTINYFER